MPETRDFREIQHPKNPTIRRGIYFLRKDKQGEWYFSDVDGRRLFSVSGYRDADEALAFLREAAKNSGAAVVGVTEQKGDVHSVFVTRSPQPVELTFNLPASAVATIDGILDETGDNLGEMFGKAVGLYKLAIDARRQGKVVGAADSPEALSIEFTGF